MATECFCGCGRKVPFGRKRLTNMFGAQVEKDLRTFEGALKTETDAQQVAALEDVVRRGRPILEGLRGVVHGTLDREQFDKDAAKAWLDDAHEQRKRLTNEALEGDYVGWNAAEQAELINSGARAPARIVDLRDTGTTVNYNPRVELVLRVEPPGEEPFEVTRKMLASRVKIPRPGERVEVFYDAADHSRLTFKISDTTDDAVAAGDEPDPVEQLAQLAQMHASGALSDEEFAAAKARVLGG